MLTWKSCIRAGVTVVLAYLAIQYWSVVARVLALMLGAAWPLLLGGAIAYIVNTLMRFYERHYFPAARKQLVVRTRRGICLAAAFLTILVILALVVGLIVPELLKCLQLLLGDGAVALKGLYEQIVSHPAVAKLFPDAGQVLASDMEETISRLVNWLMGGFGGMMNSALVTITSVFSGTVTLSLAVVFAIYILLGKEKLAGQIRRLARAYLSPRVIVRARYVLGVVDDCFHSYIVCQCIEAVILGTLCMLGMLLFGFPYATMIGTLVGVTALIPIAGAYIGAIVGAIMILTVSPIEALLFVLFIIILQQIEGNLIYPHVVGASLGLPALWVLTAVSVGGGVLGVGGMILGVPLFTVIYRLLGADVRKRASGEKRRRHPPAADS